jgi:hypothetical protein
LETQTKQALHPHHADQLEYGFESKSKPSQWVYPSDIGSLPDLEILDLSYSNLPSSLAVMPSLTPLVLSNNKLSGSPPIFYEVAVDYTGNPNLTIIDPDMMVGSEDNSSAIWIAAVSFVVSFVISFYGDVIRKRWFTPVLSMPSRPVEQPPRRDASYVHVVA